MKITPDLKSHMVEKFNLPADATEDVIRKAVSEKIVSGELSLDDVQRLTVAKATEAEQKIQGIVEAAIAKALAGAGLQVKGGDGASLPTDKAGALRQDAGNGNGTAAGSAGTAGTSAAQKGYAMAANAGTAATFESDGDFNVRVKSVVENFRDVKTAATWDKSNNEFLRKEFGGRSVNEFWSGAGVSGSVDMPTERSKAISGAWFKHLVNKAYRKAGRQVPYEFQLKDLDRKLIEYAVHECKFVGPIGYHGGDRDSDNADFWCEGLKLESDLMKKAILDDSTSGGLEAVPIEFDANLILTPLLTGELFPLVDVRQVTRRRIEGTKMSNPTLSWGTASGSTISLFDTDSFISAFDNTIYPVAGAMEVGRDFLSDSPLDIGNVIVQRYGQAFLKELDTVIAEGNGTSQPEGLFTASGVSTVTPAGGNGTAQQVGDYESLYFNIAKEFRTEPGARFIYLANDTTYKRARGIPVDTSNDARRIFGMEQGDYRIFGHPFRVVGALDNAQIAGVMINRYVMYRRAGLEVRVVTEDGTLARQDKQLIVVRARFGGSLNHSSAMVKITAGLA